MALGEIPMEEFWNQIGEQRKLQIDKERKSFLKFVTDPEYFSKYLAGMKGDSRMNRLILDNAIQRKMTIDESIQDLISVCRTLHVKDKNNGWF